VIQYEPASFTRDFEGACAGTQALVWRFFDYQAILPAGTSIRFSAVTAQTQAGLATATPSVDITVAAPPSTTGWTTGPSTVNDLLKAAGSWSKQFLRVTMEFNPSADKTEAPELLAWRQNFDCLSNE
jgi:hypothetical protein